MWVALIAHKRGIDQVIGSGNRIHLIPATKKAHLTTKNEHLRVWKIFQANGTKKQTAWLF